jgi:hypothetical protein
MRIHIIPLREMSGRSSRAVDFFCYPDEFDRLLAPILACYGLAICRAEKRNDRWFLFGVEASDQRESNLPQFYLLDSITATRGVDSLANIVQVWLPKEINDSLHMGEVGMLVAESDLGEKMVELQRSVYEELRKLLTNEFAGGVWGRNYKTGGEHFYKNILISKSVEEATRNGLILRPLLGDGFVTFAPNRIQ